MEKRQTSSNFSESRLHQEVKINQPNVVQRLTFMFFIVFFTEYFELGVQSDEISFHTLRMNTAFCSGDRERCAGITDIMPTAKTAAFLLRETSMMSLTQLSNCLTLEGSFSSVWIATIARVGVFAAFFLTYKI